MDPTARKYGVGVIVEKDRVGAITPLSPGIQTWKRAVHRGKESGAINTIECVAKVDF